VDPPPEFMARFADIEDVRPRSWCVEQRTGNRYSVGPIDARLHLFSNGRTVRAWILDQRFDGDGGSAMMQVSQKGGTWGPVERDYTFDKGVPPFRRADLREDRRRIAATLSAFANAWNRRDYDQMARLHGLEQPLAGIQVDRWRAMLGGPAANARLEPAGVAIEFGDSGHMSATAQMRLRGTWPPRAGAIARGDPWQGKGSPATVQVTLRKETSWWEPGDWSVSDFWPPWVERTASFVAVASRDRATGVRSAESGAVGGLSGIGPVAAAYDSQPWGPGDARAGGSFPHTSTAAAVGRPHSTRWSPAALRRQARRGR
jgi:hypothetical protein